MKKSVPIRFAGSDRFAGSAQSAAPKDTSDAISIGINHRLYISTVDVIERLLAAVDEESITSATLAQRVTALGVLSRILKQFEAASDHPNNRSQQEVIRIEYQDSQGRISGSPPWAGPDPEDGHSLQGRGLWASIREDGAGEDSAD